jgi:hypothetical protein
MIHRFLLTAFVAGGMLAVIGPASAQFYSGYGYGGWGGTNGSAALLGSDYRQATAMQLKSQSMLAGQQAAMEQNYVVQSGIRNTLSSQAQSQTNAILSQQQANQDWWFQQQSQQMAQRKAMEKYGAPAIPTGFAPAGGPPPATTDIIQWPTVLQEQCFASERAKIESPYRHAPPPKLSVPTPADYRSMASAVEDMKAILEWRLTEGVSTTEYNAAKEFLNRLGEEVTARAQASGS